jgi:hypothetical protein
VEISVDVNTAGSVSSACAVAAVGSAIVRTTGTGSRFTGSGRERTPVWRVKTSARAATQTIPTLSFKRLRARVLAALLGAAVSFDAMAASMRARSAAVGS